MQREPSHRAGGWQGHHPPVPSLHGERSRVAWPGQTELLPGLENDRARGEKGFFWGKKGV